MWESLHARQEDYAAEFGLDALDMKAMMTRIEYLVEGSVRPDEEARTALGVFADRVQRTVPGIARTVAREEAKGKAMPGLQAGLKDRIGRWRNLRGYRTGLRMRLA